VTGARTATLRLGTRRSALAQAQARDVADRWTRVYGADVELVGMVTDGDRSGAAVQQLAGTGVFVTELRRQLLAGTVDAVVHSLKDLPTASATGIALAAVPPRADARDALVTRAGVSFGDLPTAARVGTGAPRRVAQLRALRPDLDVIPIRGNVDTRISRVQQGAMDAVVVALAGLDRLGRSADATTVFDPTELTPAPGQGALAVECRADDAALLERLHGLDDPITRAAVTAERALLARLQAGCTAPVGALADVTDGRLQLLGAVAGADGRTVLRMTATGPVADAEGVGDELADRLIAAGATELMRESA
jgi:hydroxymethylbilane synthase